MKSPIYLLIIIPGLLAIGASIWKWEWYFRLSIAAEKTEKVGMKQARRFYFGFGIVMIVLAILLSMT